MNECGRAGHIAPPFDRIDRERTGRIIQTNDNEVNEYADFVPVRGNGFLFNGDTIIKDAPCRGVRF